MKLGQLRDYFQEEEALFRNYSPNKAKIANNQNLMQTKDLKDHVNDDDS